MASMSQFMIFLLLFCVSFISDVEGGGEVSIPARLQKSYPLYGLICFPMGMKLPCDCDEDAFCPCCRDHTTNECYMPTYKKWSDWIVCSLCDDLCDDTMECRVKYDEISELVRPSIEEPILPLEKRRKRGVEGEDDREGRPVMEDMKSWNHRCRVQRSECRTRFSGEWSDWMPVGPCSSDCHRGTQEEFRYCMDDEGNQIDDELCEGGEEEVTRDVTCNTDLCPTVSEWVSDGPCYIDGIACLESRSRICTSEDIRFPPLTDDCANEIRVCPDNSCNFTDLSTYDFGDWTECNSTCEPGWRSRVGTCVHVSDGTPSTNCDPIVKTEVEECNTEYCHQYTGWSPSGPCSVPCGGGTRPTQRFCVVSESVIPDGCDTSTADCNPDPCPVFDYDWADWGPCSENCTNGTRVRTGSCIDTLTNTPSDQCADGETTTESGPCNEDLCIEYGEWLAVGSCSETCGDGLQTYQRSCDQVGTDPTPTLPPECTSEALDCNEGICFTVSDWGDYSDCSDSCSPGNQMRTRKCLNSETMEEVVGCPEHLNETQACNEDLCTEYGGSADGQCLLRSETCQEPSEEVVGTCVGTGTVPPACAVTRYEDCTYTGPEQVVDLVVVIDSTVFLDPDQCAPNVGRAFDDPDLQDVTKFPNYMKQKEFVLDFYCVWPFIGPNKTRIGLMKHSSDCDVGDVLVKFSEDNTFLDTVNNEGLDCASDQSLLASYFCLKESFSAANGHRSISDVILYILPPLDETHASSMALVESLKDSLPVKEKFFLVTADDAPSAADIDKIKKLACLEPGAAIPCDRYLGSIHDKSAQQIADEIIAIL